MKKKLLALFLGVFLTCMHVFAQQVTVTGKVTSSDGPIPGVSIKVKGTTVVSQTNGDGTYTIKAAAKDILVFSYIGYTSVERSIGGNTTINVTLTEDSEGLNEVVVVGFGAQKKESLTGAITSVNVEKVFGNRPIPDLGRGLQGAVPGLSVVVPSGEVGSTPIIKIRGQVGSLNGSSNPLILVDNVEVPSIQYINPNDIENITVLKDAASSAIYGAKAAFGVILITTKNGANVSGNKFTYSNNIIAQTPFKAIDIAGIDGLEYTLDAYENMKGTGPAGGFWRIDRTSFEKIKEWQVKYGSTVGNNDPVVYKRDWEMIGGQKFGYRIYDPVEAMVKDYGLSQMHNLGVTGNSGNTNYNLSIGYLGQNGMMKPAKHDDYRRLNPSLTLSTKATDYLTLRGGVRYAEGTKRNPMSIGTSGFGGDPWLYLYRWSRLFPIGVQELGEDLWDSVTATQRSNDQIRNEKYLNLNLGATLNITKAWDITADYAYSTENDLATASVPFVQMRSFWNTNTTAYLDANGAQVYVDDEGNPVTTGGVPAYRAMYQVNSLAATPDKTFFSQDIYRAKRNTFNLLSNYKLDLKTHQLKFLVGSNIVGYDWATQYSKRGNLLNYDNPQYNFAVGTENTGGSANWDSQVGFFGRVNYAYKDKYLLEASVRRDATSKFPTHLRWRTYPSVSGGWVISNESFMDKTKRILSFAKLRASYGLIGDQSVPNSLYVPQMGITKSAWLGADGTPFYQLGTPSAVSGNIGWQDIEHLNLGADLRFFNGKLGLTAEVYQRYTRNMIIPGDALPATFGTSAPQGNYGDLRTRGWELNLDFSHQLSNGLKLSFDANIADAVTFITKGADFQTPWENRSLSSAFSTGRRYGDVYGFVTDRLYQKDDFVYDSNGNFVQTNVVWRGTSKKTNVQAGSNPVYQTYFEDGNQTMLMSPGDVKFVDVNGDGYIDAGDGTNGNPGDKVVVGNSTPRYQYGFRLGADYKGFGLSVFFQGVGKRKIWGNGQLALAGYSSKEGAMPQAIAENYWKPDRTDAFYPRAWDAGGGSDEFYVMRTQSRYMLNMAYLKIKNITLSYNLPAALLKRVKISNARVYVSLENFITFDKLRGLPIDPETITGYSMLTDGTYNQGRTGTSNPTFKSASAGLQIGF
ncbi:TonB-dependent receptor [Pedobacter sp. UBA4863]|uniref:SusC/RagA family TonB-linked outer membrane protein n=1 Tax=Pedobacter sp. UBA4863 TaxID=1947060 RepID=UPI0025FC4DAC|nr:TonB-dependent receptor [Pedobacter sp. UBA4863]